MNYIKLIENSGFHISEDLVKGCVSFHQNKLFLWLLKELNENKELLKSGIENSIFYENYEVYDLLIQNKIDIPFQDLFKIAIKRQSNIFYSLLSSQGAQLNSDDILTLSNLAERIPLSQNDINEIKADKPANNDVIQRLKQYASSQIHDVLNPIDGYFQSKNVVYSNQSIWYGVDNAFLPDSFDTESFNSDKYHDILDMLEKGFEEEEENEDNSDDENSEEEEENNYNEEENNSNENENENNYYEEEYNFDDEENNENNMNLKKWFNQINLPNFLLIKNHQIYLLTYKAIQNIFFHEEDQTLDMNEIIGYIINDDVYFKGEIVGKISDVLMKYENFLSLNINITIYGFSNLVAKDYNGKYFKSSISGTVIPMIPYDEPDPSKSILIVKEFGFDIGVNFNFDCDFTDCLDYCNGFSLHEAYRIEKLVKLEKDYFIFKQTKFNSNTQQEEFQSKLDFILNEYQSFKLELIDDYDIHLYHDTLSIYQEMIQIEISTLKERINNLLEGKTMEKQNEILEKQTKLYFDMLYFYYTSHPYSDNEKINKRISKEFKKLISYCNKFCYNYGLSDDQKKLYYTKFWRKRNLHEFIKYLKDNSWNSQKIVIEKENIRQDLF